MAFISETRLFYRMVLICSLASEDIKQNEMIWLPVFGVNERTYVDACV